MEFKTVIGLEIHVQLKTKSKMFCRCDNNAEEASPNTLVCPICMGYPGTLPVANESAIQWTIKTGLALSCEIADFAKFDRKHYFYPDLPKGYQISQYDMPFCKEGFLEIDVIDKISRIGIRRVHLEEDAGKLVHPAGKNYSLVDLNRAGTPLMEIVTDPDLSSPLEAKIFMQELRSILRYLDVSDADMEKGHLRCDANISIEVDGREGVPVEIKNMNSFRMVERALSYEEKRQKERIENGEKVVKETRGWNDAKAETYSQRSKEFAQDYRYFPEPDLPPFSVKKCFDIDEVKSSLPELPDAKRKRYIQMGLTSQDAALIAVDRDLAAYFEKVAEDAPAKLAANWVINELKSEGLMAVSPENLQKLLQKIDKNEITGKIAKEIFIEMLSGKKVEDIIKEKQIDIVSDEESIGEIIEEVLKENAKSVQDFKNGKMQAKSYLIGQVMAKTRGRANPTIINKILDDKLKE